MIYNFNELVEQAKGKDRSLREYARESGVDAAVISKIIKGKYIPKKTAVFYELTKPEAHPRNGVTYEMLKEAAAVSRAKSIAFAQLGPMGVLGLSALTVTSLLAPKTSSPKTQNSDSYTEVYKKICGITTELIKDSLFEKGIPCKLQAESTPPSDTVIEMKGADISEYIIKHAYMTSEFNADAQTALKLMLGEAAFYIPESNKKVTIATNNVDLYNYMLAYKGQLSYNGDLSILLVDDNKPRIIREDYLAHFAGKNDENELLLI